MYKKKLLELGIPADMNGFYYLNYAIEIYRPIQPMMELYTEVGKKWNISNTIAERNMRHAIKQTGQKITTGQFITKYKIIWDGENNE